MARIVWIFGLISGVIVSALMLIMLPFQHQIGFNRALVVGYTTMVLSFLLIYFGIRAYRENVGGGRVGFGRAFVVGALIGLVSSVCYTITWEAVYFGGFVPNFSQGYITAELDHMKAAGAPQAEIDKKAGELKDQFAAYDKPLVNIAYTIIEPLPVAIVIALVSAGILSRRRQGRELGHEILQRAANRTPAS